MAGKPWVRKGSRKYRCDECNVESFHHWIERNRSARIRCPACGSGRMNLAAETAKDEARTAADNLVFGLPGTQRPDGDKPC